MTPSFLRWKIIGTLVTLSPLHIGTGEWELTDDFVCNGIARDIDELPLIPGSSLRGVLAHRAAESGMEPQVFARLFGTKAVAEDDSHSGGRLDICECRWQASLDGTAQTRAVSGVSIDPARRAAQARRLFQHDMVPEGTAFQVEIHGYGLAGEDVQALLSVLAGFSVHGGTRLGRGTRNAKGLMEWELRECLHFGLASALAYVQSDGTRRWDQVPEVLAAAENHTDQFSSVAAPPPSSGLRIGVEVRFTSPFLISERRAKDKTDTPQLGPRHARYQKPDQAWHEQTQAALEEQSLMGALRAQAARIERTLKNGDTAVTDLIFGITGMARLLSPDRFQPVSPGRAHRQEFVAVDRLTGGAADGMKFTIDAPMGACYRGCLTLEIGRGKERLTSALGLLALVLRDWQDGRITLGYGRSKGFGRCQARITELTLIGPWPDAEIGRDLVCATGAIDSVAPETKVALDRAMRAAVQQFLEGGRP